MLDHEHTDRALDDAIAQIRAAQPDPAVVAAAAERVWDRISAPQAADVAAAADVAEIRGCDDYQTLIPAHLSGSLPPARKTLLEDHLGECVPCRRALKAARAGEQLAPQTQDRPRTRSFAGGRLALAALLIVGLGAGAMLIWQSMPFSSGPAATVTAVDGDLFRVAAGSLPIDAGAPVQEGEHIRSGRSGGAVVALADGSQVELRARSEISIEENRRGTTIHLDRGSVIVQAAKQRDRKLYVATDDCLVSVTGTIFSVNHGTKGSRVAVVEGEVKVDFSGEEKVLLPGDQVTTTQNLAAMPIGQELSWSRNIDQYLAMLGELQALEKAIHEAVGASELRYSSQLLDLMPAGTVFYTGLPNLAETISESYRAAIARLDESPVLAAWWQDNHGPDRLQPAIDEIITRVEALGAYLGDEVAVGVSSTGDANPVPLVAADVLSGTGLRDFVEGQIDQFVTGIEPLVFLDDDLESPTNQPAIYAWTNDEVMVASSSLGAVQRAARAQIEGAVSSFVGTPFHQEITERYSQGASVLAAFDLETVVGHGLASGTEQGRRAFRVFGIDNARFITVERKGTTENTHHEMALTFSDSRHGVSSWLAEPAPMGSLEFISPDAHAFTALVIKDPALMLQDIEAAVAGDNEASEGFARVLTQFRDHYGLDLQEDVASVLGGEIAFALDGPLVPVPSWKLIAEVYDPARFQWVVERSVEETNARLAETGMDPIALTKEQVGGRTFYSLPVVIGEIHYTFVDGYMIAAPGRALLDRAIRFRDSGYTVTSSQQFAALLPHDRHENFSALFYQDIGSLFESVVERLTPAGLTEQQQAALEAIQLDAKPMLAFAYGEDDRIAAAVSSERSLLGNALLGLFGWLGPGGLQTNLTESLALP